jgi:multiple sugar transport system substrate-binding protein
MSRTRRSIALLASATALATLAGCSSSSSSGGSTAKAGGKVTISFMQIMDSGTQKSELVALTDAFEKANPDITVDLEYQDSYGNLLAKETAGVAAHNAPTLGQVYESWASTRAAPPPPVCPPSTPASRTTSSCPTASCGCGRSTRASRSSTTTRPC